MRRFLRATSLLLILSIIVGCAVPAPPRMPAATSAAQAQESAQAQTPAVDCADAGQATEQDRDVTQPMGLDTDMEHILVTGLEPDVDMVMREAQRLAEGVYRYDLNSVVIGIIPLETIQNDLEDLFGVAQLDGAGGNLAIARIPVQLSNIQLSIPEPTNQMRLAAAISIVRLASSSLYGNGASLPVFAELNLSTSLLKPENTAGPGVFFDPNGVGAHPCGGLSVSEGASMNAFWNQWAFQADRGIGLFDPSSDPPSYVGCDAGINTTQVVIFDTSAFSLPNSNEVGGVGIPISPPCASDSGALNLEFSDYTLASPTSDNLKHHGLFVTTLAYAVAPNARFHLTRVLDDKGSGYLSYLLGAMAHWSTRASYGELPMVFNLSLGVNPPRVTMTNDEWDTVRNALGIDENLSDLATGNPLAKDASFTAPAFPSDRWAPRVALEMVIRIARNAGVVIVAASGNEGSFEQYPAIYAPVLGVGASSLNSTKSCYSNEGDVYAPAGDTSSHNCNPKTIETCDDKGCEYAILSLIGEEPDYTFAFWSGTSFAAPLVTGMVALQLNRVASQTGHLQATVENFVMKIQDPTFESNDCIPLLDAGTFTEVVPRRCILDVNRMMLIPYN